MAIRRSVFETLGGFDEDFFAYYEDLDLGWRAWIAGYETHYVPSAVCTHHHSHTSKRFPPEVIRRMVVRNSLLTCIKNYDDTNLARVLPALSTLAAERAFLRSGLDADAFSPREVALREPGEPNDPDRVHVDGIGAADLVAMHDVFGNWDAVMSKRRAVQATRRRTDASIFEMFLEPLACVEGDASYQELQRGMRAWLGLDSIFDE